MDPHSAAEYLTMPWSVQKQDMNHVKAAWEAVCQENTWITMEEWTPGDRWPFCRPCRKWCQDDHAASRCCIAKQREMGNAPGYILAAIIQFKHQQRTQTHENELEDRGSQHGTQRPLPLPATVT